MPLPPVPAFHPIADPQAVITSGGARFSILTDRLIRIEWSKDSCFEDRPSQAFWHRLQPVPKFELSNNGENVVIETDFLCLSYKQNYRGFSSKTLSILLKESGVVWHYGDNQADNLKGTARTLDGDSGNTKLENGLLSRSGWAVVDDSKTPVFNDSGWIDARYAGNQKTSWISRLFNNQKDLYFFGYGKDYVACLSDFTKIAGTVPMIPRFILGNWWSRYWEYTQDELKNLMLDFRAHEVPLSVCIIDMDWHITKTGNRSDGWTGYTWNKNLFPDPQGLIKWLHEQGLRTSLNLHPARGIYPHEEQYEKMANWMRIDPASHKTVKFDIADPHFAEGYLEILHHPFEKMVPSETSSEEDARGIDFWWMDYQQERKTSIAGLDPLWMLNHLHFYDLGRNARKRPFVFSRWGGLGNHRYPIGFSGDTYVRWSSLEFQPYFTSTAANVGYGWWSHDIGGHMMNDLTPELYLRWVQFGVFSPIMRLHSTKRETLERRPWAKPERIYQAARTAMQMRHALIPYIYSMAWRAHQTGISLVTPMYYDQQADTEAYQAKEQYYFGSELLVAPVVEPAPSGSTIVEKKVWFPRGKWTNFFTGEHIQGIGWQKVSADLEDIPVFARSGAIVPLGPLVGWGGLDNPETLDLYVFPGADNTFDLYEDDGNSTGYERGEYCITHFSMNKDGLTIHAAEGHLNLIPSERAYRIHLRGVDQNTQTSIRGRYDPETNTLSLDPITKPSDQSLLIRFNNLSQESA